MPASPANSSLGNPPAGSRFDCPSMTFTIGHANDSWRAQDGGSPPPGTTYEAEAAGNTLAGQAAVRGSPGASGGALVGYVGNGTANYLQFNNINATAGPHTVSVFYASGEGRSLTMSASGAAAVGVSTPSTVVGIPSVR
ncbi:hypothetical protein [Actinocrispum sp. NPDC049592]|uniref:hypothetical protein n=1 Tax=Actinocrispum sp. NPDC049592 TaxID=3154835 RepID=UPI00343DD3F7